MQECGLTYAKINLKIVGGIDAAPYSWPSLAYIEFNYKAQIRIKKHYWKTFPIRASCGGTLIDRVTILTVAHCIQTTLTVTYEDKVYFVNVKPNSYFPTYESMFKIYLGIQNLSTIVGLSSKITINHSYSDSALQIFNVSKIIIVSFVFK